MVDPVETDEVLTSWGGILVRIVDNSTVECVLPDLRNGVPESPLSIHEPGHSSSAHFICQLLSGKNVPVPPIGPLPGTVFQQKVWAAIRAIPYGETRSYGELAKTIGAPKSCRAVANACGKNPVPLFIPCHRVVGSNGTLGGFSSGLAWKRQLLSLEHG